MGICPIKPGSKPDIKEVAHNAAAVSILRMGVVLEFRQPCRFQ